MKWSLAAGMLLSLLSTTANAKAHLPLCGVFRVYSPKLSLLVVPKSLTKATVERYELIDKTGQQSFALGAPWWICVTEGKVLRAAKGDLSSGDQGNIEVTAFSTDQTSLEMGVE